MFCNDIWYEKTNLRVDSLLNILFTDKAGVAHLVIFNLKYITFISILETTRGWRKKIMELTNGQSKLKNSYSVVITKKKRLYARYKKIWSKVCLILSKTWPTGRRKNNVWGRCAYAIGIFTENFTILDKFVRFRYFVNML